MGLGAKLPGQSGLPGQGRVGLPSDTSLQPLNWFVDPNGNLLADFIGKFERLDEDWAFVAQKLGLQEKLPHRRANPRERHYTEYYSPRTRDIVAVKFKVDIERFGYEFAG